jgi:hypothetical protein
MKKTKIKWLGKPQKRDYPAARSYLSLLLQPKVAKAVVEKFRRAQITDFAAKDIFRASMLPLLGTSNSHVEKYRQLIILREPLSPLLLYRDTAHGKLIIADGYHRLCAVYTFDEYAVIPCHIV